MKTRNITAGVSAIAMTAALAFSHEGPRFLRTYLDPLSIPTICRGITGGVKIGDVLMDKDCDEKEEAAIREAHRTIERCAPGVPLADHEWAAWGSFVYNVGPGKKGVKDGFCVLKNGREPTLLKKLKAGDYAGACNELPKWANPSWLRGLKIRRAEERAVCLGQ